jgi:glutamine synthetase
VDTHADIMRATCATSGNDHRLGANEAPPAIISAFLGDELTDILERLGKGQKATSRGQNFLDIGVDTLPELPKDNTDRNRTSPFAFTGNKFEFRTVGSSQSISGPNVALNTIVAEALDEIATRLEKAGSKNRNTEIAAIVREISRKHARVIFNGNNYAEEWEKEADKRGLPNVRNAVAALEAFVTPKAVKLFEKYKVLSKEELHSRYDIYLEQYSKHINIEAQTAVQMTRRQFLPVAMRFMTELGNSVAATGKHGAVQRALLEQVGELLASAHKKADVLESEAAKARSIGEVPKQAAAFRDKVFPALQKLRADVDALEGIAPRDLWPVPTYSDMLFKL